MIPSIIAVAAMAGALTAMPSPDALSRPPGDKSWYERVSVPDTRSRPPGFTNWSIRLGAPDEFGRHAIQSAVRSAVLRRASQSIDLHLDLGGGALQIRGDIGP